MSEWIIVLRILVAATLAALLGIEREWKGQSAGFRTHILVAIGSCLFTLVGTYAFLPDPGMRTEGVSVDPTRVPSQIVVGIGFLGGGAILKYGVRVRGLTTAANLWLAAAVGMAVGVGYYMAAVVCVVLSIVSLSALRPIEQKLFNVAQKTRREEDLEQRQAERDNDEQPGAPH